MRGFFILNSIKAIFVIIGTVIGAGFASGQEIYSFFSKYGENGIIGITISAMLIGLIIYNILKKTNQMDIKSYKELLEAIKIPNHIKTILNLIINIFLIISFYIMVSGFAAYFKQEFNIPNFLTATIVVILCYITFMKNIDGITKVNTILVPILILVIISLGLKANIPYIITNIDITNIELSSNWIIKCIEYASYNSILLIPILISLKNYTLNKEKRISIIVTIILFVLSIIIYLMMFNVQELSNMEIPLMYIANSSGNLFSLIYSLVIVFAIYTTMISAGYSFLNNCTKNPKNYKTLAMVICISAIFISNLSFSKLVNLTYPVFGILGIIQLICFRQ